MESLYIRFDSYDFDSDARFQDGLKKVNTPTCKEDLLKLKIYFYNRAILCSSEWFSGDENFNQKSGIRLDKNVSRDFAMTAYLKRGPGKEHRHEGTDKMFFEPIDLSGYKEWCAVSDKSHQAAEEMSSVQDDFGTSNSEKVILPQTDMEAKSAQNIQLSFAEVFQMIQEGKEIPGLQKLDIKPCNQLPTSSQMPRKLKPWEK
ncbi:uncharacterized protein LOC124399718 isoform X1 [Silurus meridionalis]|uniref:Uncharacterized protein n=1 Tax=Silurus meridionalis TaxID=175797 RepID=A0A8T0AQC5_SILME|nr:uncharacterized protein LOC124399718 isoform X1 [Silurus meridionalis]KAF7695314.1 hypothetical protein HF521_007037 [Silurus meridionalis]